MGKVNQPGSDAGMYWVQRSPDPRELGVRGFIEAIVARWRVRIR